ncbi:MAG: hypothetical protein R2734_01950 [Nocardioides sp.]
MALDDAETERGCALGSDFSRGDWLSWNWGRSRAAVLSDQHITSGGSSCPGAASAAG